MSTAKQAKTKLCQVIAVEKGIKSRASDVITEAYKTIQKPDLFNGFSRKYTSSEDGGVTYPNETQVVRETVSDLLARVQKSKSDLYDVTAQKDYANTNATADVEVGGKVIVEGAPVSYLLFLEKELTDLRTFISKLPTQDNSETWKLDGGSGLHKSQPISRIKTRKTSRPIVLYEATDKHPAQTQLINEDVIEGTWETTIHTGAIEETRKRELLEKVETLLKAVKFAREEANQNEAPAIDVASKIFGYLFS